MQAQTKTKISLPNYLCACNETNKEISNRVKHTQTKGRGNCKQTST